MDKTSLAYDLTILPWQRAIRQMETHNNVLIGNLDRTSDRENDFLWLAEYATIDYSLITRNEEGLRDLSLEDAVQSGHRAVCYTESHFCQLLQIIGFKEDQIDVVFDLADGFLGHYILRGRASFFVEEFTYLSGRAELAGWQANEFVEIAQVATSQSYLVAPLHIDPAIREALERADGQ